MFFLGRIHHIKGLDFLLEGFQEFHRQVADAALVIAGPDDGYEKQLKDMVIARGLAGNVFFPGPLFGEERLASYVDADILVYPGRYEIFGLVPLEALLCGTPVIVSAGTAADQIIREAGAGGIIEFGDVKMLAQEIYDTLTDAERSAARVAAGKAYVKEHLDWKAIVKNLEDLYGEARPTKGSPAACPEGTAGF